MTLQIPSRARAMRRLAVVACLIAAFALLAACSSSSAEGVPGSFYLEATVTVIDGSPGASHPEVVTQIRWWSESRDRWRWELDQTGAGEFSADGSVSVSDGETVWYYNARENSYQQHEPFPLPENFVATSLPFSVLVGPANVESLEGLMASFMALGDDTEVAVVGTERVLGTETSLFEYRPLWHSSSATASLDDNGVQTQTAEQETSGGVGRMWVDEARMFVLRHELDGGAGGEYARVEVTRVDFEPSFDDGLFTFTPPDGAIEVEAGAGSSSSGSSGSGSSESGSSSSGSD